MDINKEREVFEVYMAEKYKNLIDRRKCLNNGGGYMAWDMNVAWQVWQAAKANAVPEWISVEDKKPEGACLVKLKERTLHNIMHTALFESEFQIIGGHFAWDMPKVTHWMPLPQEPSHD